MEKKTISPAVIRRLPRYYRYLGELLDQEVEGISSYELSKRMHSTASQIRQDLNNFDNFGHLGYGYNVKNLRDKIGEILGLDQSRNLIVIGAGHLGQAIANYAQFERMGFTLTGLFDINPDLAGKEVRGIPILMLDDLDRFALEHRVDIAALTIPKSAALSVARLLTGLGVPSIWNFAHVDLEVGEKTVVENVHLSDSLMELSYNLMSRSRDSK